MDKPGGFGPITPIPGFDAPDAVSIRDPYARPGVLTPDGARPIVKVLGLEKFFGSNHVLRGCTLEVYPQRDDLPHRQVRVRQEHAAALHELPRGAHDGLRRGGRDPGRRRPAQPAQSRRTASRSARSACGAQMVFQEFNLFPHLRVIDNLIEAPIRVKGLVAR